MLHPQDEQSLQRILGGVEIPLHVREEAELQTKMYHRDGNSGPIGSMLLIPLIRSLGITPERLIEKPEHKSWMELPANSRVEAYYMGIWHPGTYQGLGPNGVLAVKLDTDPNVRECRPDMLRLPGHEETLASNGQQPQQPTAAEVDAGADESYEIDGLSVDAQELADEEAAAAV